MNIIESITQSGIISTSSEYTLRARYTRPRSGDHVRWTGGKLDGTLGRIWTLSDTYSPEGCAQVCEDQGSAFLTDGGGVDISGGPFVVIRLADLEPTYEVHYGECWNWGDNMAGAHKGVHFRIPRPVFKHTGA